MQSSLLVRFLAVLLTTSAIPENAGAETFTKIWSYGYSGKIRAWKFMYVDQWGGQNYQCSQPGFACGIWDWMAVYHGAVQPDIPTPEWTNTEAFGDSIAHYHAISNGDTLPVDLGTPEFQMGWNLDPELE